MSQISRRLLVFSIVFTVLIAGPAFLGSAFGPYPLMKWGDVLDILTPLILLPLYWGLLRSSSDALPSPREMGAFVLLAALWVEGQGMHLAANSIGHVVQGGDGSQLTHFYDEVLSHYLWHLGVIGLVSLIFHRHWRTRLSGEFSWRTIIPAGIIHGFTLFLIFIEAVTIPLGLPFLTILMLIILIWGRARLGEQPVTTFFFITSLVALLFLTGWGLYWGGFPEFSAVGLI